MLIYTYLELYYIYVLYDIIYLLQSVPPSGSVFFINKRIEYQTTVVRLAYITSGFEMSDADGGCYHHYSDDLQLNCNYIKLYICEKL